MGNLQIYVVFICVLMLSSMPFIGASTERRPLKIVSVTYASYTAYDEPLSVEITVSHEPDFIPTVAVFYTYFLNQTSLATGWRIASTYLRWVNGLGLSIFTAVIPNPAYHEPIQITLDAKFVFYVEVRDDLGNVILSCREADRWNANVQDDKFTFTVIDLYPPNINWIKKSPRTPSSSDTVTISANVTDDGSGIATLALRFQIREGKSDSVAMSLWSEDIYIAEIPPQMTGVEVKYYLEACDKAGNKIMSVENTYTVISSPEEQLQQSRLVLASLSVVAIILLAVGASFWRRSVRLGSRDENRATCTHPKAMTIMMGGVLFSAIWVYYQVLMEGLPLTGLIVAGIMIMFWGLLDPRVSTKFLPKETFNRSPPTTLIAEGYLLALFSVLVLAIGRFIGVYDLLKVYTLAVILVESVVVLSTSGLILTLAWPYAREISISLE